MTMPSPTDAISTGLRFSLAGASRKVSNDSNGESNSLDSALAAGNKLAEITKHHVEYESSDNQQSNTQNVLKSKYIVLDTKLTLNAQNLNGSSTNGTKDPVSNGSAMNGLKNGNNGSITSHQTSPQLNGMKGAHSNGLSFANVNGFSKSISVGSMNGIKKLGSNGIMKSGSTTNTTENGSSKAPINNDSTLPEPKQVLYNPDKVTLGWQSHFRAGAGMVNLGNTCYLNATLQALFHVPAFVDWLLNDVEHMKKCEQVNGPGFGDCITCSMAKTLRLSQNHPIVKPTLITNKIKMIWRHMSHGSQEDAHEFIRHLLENMEKAYLVRCKAQKLDPYSKETTPINQIFGGYIRTEVKCLRCSYASTTFQHFQDLILDIRKASKVEDALDQYFSREKLDGENSYKCEKCKCGVPATKKFSIERPPKVLCIQLKRFNAVGLKLAKPVEHRIHMDLKRFVHPQSTYAKFPGLPYKLISMVTHVGPSSGCGHYTAIAQCASKTFHHFDDTHVHPVSLNTVLNTGAYILIYEMEPQSLMQASKLIASSSAASITAPSNNNHNNVNGNTKNAPQAPGGLPLAKDRDRVTFGLSSAKPISAQPRLVIHPKRADASNSLPLPLKSSNNHNGSVSKEARSPNFIGPIQVVGNGKHLTSSPAKEKPIGVKILKSSDLLNQNDMPRKDLINSSKLNESEKKPLASLVPYDCDDDSSSRDSSLSPPFNDDQEVLTVKATKPSDWQVTSLSGLRSPSIHSESSNHSVASATGSNWNVTENQSVTNSNISKNITALKVMKDKKVNEVSPPIASYSSDPELESRQTVKPIGKDNVRAKSVERDLYASGNTCPSKHTLSVKKPRIRRSSQSSESDSSSSKMTKKKARIELMEDKVPKQKDDGRHTLSVRNNDGHHGAVVSNRKPEGISSVTPQNSSSMWNGEGNSNTVNDLMKMSHQGFGNDRVASWNGEQSQIEKHINDERKSSSWNRSRDAYEMELDQGRMKKVKKDYRWRPYPNSIQPGAHFQQNRRNKKHYHNSHYQFNNKNNQHSQGHRKWQPEYTKQGNHRYY